jgi:replicative DNA helicase
MPESVAGEAAVLGSMLIDPNCIPQVIEILGGQSDSFYRPENKMLFEAIIHLYEKMYTTTLKRKINLNELIEELERNNRLEFVGGVNYIAQLTRCAKPKKELPDLIKIIKGQKCQ